MPLTIEDVTYLGASACNTEEGGRLVMTVRLEPSNFVSSNIAFTEQQAVRMWRDLCLLMAGSEIMKKAIEKNPDEYAEFVETMAKLGNEQYIKALAEMKKLQATPEAKTTRTRRKKT